MSGYPDYAEQPCRDDLEAYWLLEQAAIEAAERELSEDDSPEQDRESA